MSAAAMGSGWYFATRVGPAGRQTGPLSWEDLVLHARGGSFGPGDLVWHEQLGDWRRASQIPGLFPTPVVGAAAVAGPGDGAPTDARTSAHAAYPAARSGSAGSKLSWLLPLLALVIVGVGLGVYFGAFYHKGETFEQSEGQILLEPSAVAGPDSFAEQIVTVGPTTAFEISNPSVTLPTLKQTSAVTTAGSGPAAIVLAAYPGDTPALYGGSASKVMANREADLAFLQADLKRAAAFCEALNSDPTLRWSGGDQVGPDQLTSYFAELTPMILTRDTRVTTYGYKDEHPTPRQSVLQAGQLVLVDRYGVPRERCEYCNPLISPRASKQPPVYTGQKWSGFDPTTVVVIQQTTAIIDSFVVIDIETGATFEVPAGADGAAGRTQSEGTGEG